MTTYALSPFPDFQNATDAGVPLSGGKVYTYTAGTSTPVATFTEHTGGTAHTNPVVLDSAGRAEIWLDTSLYYKMVLTNAAGTIIKTIDYVSASGIGGGSTVNSSINGTQGKIALFTSEHTIGNSIITQSVDKIGIGTDAPASKLTVLDTSADAVDLLDLIVGTTVTNNAKTVGISLSGRSASYSCISTIRCGHETDGTSRASYLNFLTRESGGSVTEKLRISSDGKVGIGTTAPNSLLSLGSLVAAQKFLIYDATNTRYGFGIQSNELRFFSGGIDTCTTIGYVSATDGSTFTERVRFQADGKVGIGTTAPQSPIHLSTTASAAIYQQITNGATGYDTNAKGARIGVSAAGDLELYIDSTKCLYSLDNDVFLTAPGGVHMTGGSPYGVLSVTSIGNVNYDYGDYRMFGISPLVLETYVPIIIGAYHGTNNFNTNMGSLQVFNTTSNRPRTQGVGLNCGNTIASSGTFTRTTDDHLIILGDKGTLTDDGVLDVLYEASSATNVMWTGDIVVYVMYSIYTYIVKATVYAASGAQVVAVYTGGIGSSTDTDDKFCIFPTNPTGAESAKISLKNRLGGTCTIAYEITCSRDVPA